MHTKDYFKYMQINEDLFELFNQLSYQEKRTQTIMNDLSKKITHYTKEAVINKRISLKNLRKTYITWVNRSMGKSTGLLTSHSGEQVLKDHHIDSTILSAIEEAVLKVRIFGTQSSLPKKKELKYKNLSSFFDGSETEI